MTSGEAGAFSAAGAAPGAMIVVVFTLRTPDELAAAATAGAADAAGMMSFWPICRLSARTPLRCMMAFASVPSLSAMAWGVSPGATV